MIIAKQPRVGIDEILVIRQYLVGAFFPQRKWFADTGAYIRCPGAKRHTWATGEMDCVIDLATMEIRCWHTACADDCICSMRRFLVEERRLLKNLEHLRKVLPVPDLATIGMKVAA